MGDVVPMHVGNEAPLLLTPYGRPESLFRLDRISVDSRGGAHVSMATGAWLVGADGRPAAGALGVLLDDVLGQAVIVRRPPGCWAVTTELMMELVSPLPVDGSRLDAGAEAVMVDAAGGLARGTVRNVRGDVVAIGSTWSRFTPSIPAAVTADVDADTGPQPGNAPIARLLVPAPDGAGLVIEDRPEFGNPAGVLHGGVVAWAIEGAARAAVAPCDLDTASLRAVYLRPAVAPVTCLPRVLHRGRSLAAVEVLVSGADGRTCVVGTVSMRSPGAVRGCLEPRN